jgi:hypothetical protein
MRIQWNIEAEWLLPAAFVAAALAVGFLVIWAHGRLAVRRPPATGPVRFSVRRLFLVTAIIATAFGIVVWLNRELHYAHVSAYHSAYHEGRITLEEAREAVGDQVDAWTDVQRPSN